MLSCGSQTKDRPSSGDMKPLHKPLDDQEMDLNKTSSRDEYTNKCLVMILVCFVFFPGVGYYEVSPASEGSWWVEEGGRARKKLEKCDIQSERIAHTLINHVICQWRTETETGSQDCHTHRLPHWHVCSVSHTPHTHTPTHQHPHSWAAISLSRITATSSLSWWLTCAGAWWRQTVRQRATSVVLC